MAHFKLSRYLSLKHPLVLTLFTCALQCSTADAAGKNLDSLSSPARDLALTSMAFTDELWDERAGLCWLPTPRAYGKRHGSGKPLGMPSACCCATARATCREPSAHSTPC